MKKNPLGKKISIAKKYSPDLLFSIPRNTGRKENKIDDIIFHGFDVWNCYELSWLDKDGKPESRRLRIVYSSDSPNIVESKSLKIYLSSFIFKYFENEENVIFVIKKDLSKILGTDDVKISLYDFSKKIKYNKIKKNLWLDKAKVKIDEYKPNSKLIELEDGNKKIIERYSNSLITNCPITKQPDYATIYLKYKSNLFINDASLLKYIASFREHYDFHESSCERIFMDIFNKLNPKILIVKCFYNRRGGIEINPVRFIGEKVSDKEFYHYWRQ